VRPLVYVLISALHIFQTIHNTFEVNIPIRGFEKRSPQNKNIFKTVSALRSFSFSHFFEGMNKN
jgi:hypothetical protein